MSKAAKDRLADLTARAERRTMCIRTSPEGFQLANPWRVVCTGTLDNIDAWLTAAEGAK